MLLCCYVHDIREEGVEMEERGAFFCESGVGGGEVAGCLSF